MTDAVDKIVSQFGSQVALAKAIGCGQSVIAQWKRRGGVIPARQQIKILEAARARGIDLSPADFFPATVGRAA